MKIINDLKSYQSKVSKFGPPPICIDKAIKHIDKQWKSSTRKLLKYGDHTPNCDFHLGGKCDCGWSKVLKKLGRENYDHWKRENADG